VEVEPIGSAFPTVSGPGVGLAAVGDIVAKENTMTRIMHKMEILRELWQSGEAVVGDEIIEATQDEIIAEMKTRVENREKAGKYPVKHAVAFYNEISGAEFVSAWKPQPKKAAKAKAAKPKKKAAKAAAVAYVEAPKKAAKQKRKAKADTRDATIAAIVDLLKNL